METPDGADREHLKREAGDALPVLLKSKICRIDPSGRSMWIQSVLRVIGLSSETTCDDLRSTFSEYGQLVLSELCVDPVTKQSTGRGLIMYEDEKGQSFALGRKHWIKGNWVDVVLASVYSNHKNEVINPYKLANKNNPIPKLSLFPPSPEYAMNNERPMDESNDVRKFSYVHWANQDDFVGIFKRTLIDAETHFQSRFIELDQNKFNEDILVFLKRDANVFPEKVSFGELAKMELLSFRK